jgi:hypothetical protein
VTTETREAMERNRRKKNRDLRSHPWEKGKLAVGHHSIVVLPQDTKKEKFCL